MHGIAIIGTGAIGRTHAEAFLRDGRCSMKALCSRTLSRSRALIDELCPEMAEGITLTDDWHTLLDRDDIDIFQGSYSVELEHVQAFANVGNI